MAFRRTLTVFALGLGLSAFAVGCAADSDEPTQDDEGEVSDDVVSGKTFHYAPKSPSVFWKPGCGVRPPDGHICETGLFIRYTRAYIDLKVTKTGSYDAATNTLTVKLDTWSKSATHPMTLVALMAQEERLELSTGAPTPRFAVRVVDWKGTQLFTGQIAALPAP